MDDNTAAPNDDDRRPTRKRGLFSIERVIEERTAAADNKEEGEDGDWARSSSHVSLRESAVHGAGLFADRAIEAGEFVISQEPSFLRVRWRPGYERFYALDAAMVVTNRRTYDKAVWDSLCSLHPRFGDVESMEETTQLLFSGVVMSEFLKSRGDACRAIAEMSDELGESEEDRRYVFAAVVAKLQLNGMSCAAVCETQWFVLSSFMNHSCSPNTVLVTTGGSASFLATRDIADGEEVFFNYVGREHRPYHHEMLWHDYQIECPCPPLSRALCWACEKDVPDGSRSLCGKCGVATYCSRSCQVVNWRDVHRSYCAIVKEVSDFADLTKTERRGGAATSPGVEAVSGE